MSKGGNDAPSPDPQIGAAALKQAQTGEQWLEFAKDAYAVSTERQKGLDELSKKVTDMQLGVAGEQLTAGREARERYRNVFQPIEDQYIKEATNYGTEARQQEAAAEAKADVQSQAAASRETARREAASLGISPTSGRYAGIERAGELGTALATAGAQNTARQSVRDKALALKADVVNLGRGVPAQAAAATSLGLSAGSSAYGTGAQNQQLSMQPYNMMASGYQGAMSGYQGQGSLLAQQYGLQLDAWKAQQEMNAQNAAGFGSALGSIAGMFSFTSDKKAKKNVKGVKKGAGIKAVKAMPIKRFDYRQGRGDGGAGHVGPMADDYKRATGRGSGKVIRAQDAIGITMQAVKDVDQKVDRMAKQLGIAA
jgi:hypothetical protein